MWYIIICIITICSCWTNCWIEICWICSLYFIRVCTTRKT